MRVLVWHEEVQTIARWQIAFGRRGHHIRRARSSEEAIALLRSEKFDLLIFDLMVGEEGGLSVALMAEFHQPGIVSILLTERQDAHLNDMFARLSNLRCVLGVETEVDDLVAIGEAAVLEKLSVLTEKAEDHRYHGPRPAQLAEAAEAPAPYIAPFGPGRAVN